LQSVLTSVELNSRFQENPRFKDERIANLNIIKEQVNNGANLISNVRKLSQLEEMPLSLQKVEINNLLENARDFINEKFPHKVIDIKIENHQEMYSVKANEFLQDVFENIFFNAVKHNEQSPIEILVTQTKTIKQEKSCIKIVFIDNGIGVEDVRKNEIFRREIRGDKSVSGIGLGLLLTKKIIESYNGQIWVEDRIKGDHSKGSKFIVMIPAAE
jgi:signal transduction histidine kinase